MLVAIAITAVVVAAATAAWVRRVTRIAINDAIGGRPGLDPVEEHQRLLAEVTGDAATHARRAELLDRALDGLTLGVVVTDAAGIVVVRNHLAGALAGQPHVQTLVEAARDDLTVEALAGAPAERELDVSGPPARTLALSAVPIIGPAAIEGTLFVIDDVTDSRRIDSTRRDFIANLTHELRTPIGAISLLSEMLVDEDDGETRATLTQRLVLETARVSDTIDDLLELSRIESDTQSYADVVVVQALIDDAVARTRVAAEAKGVAVTTRLPDQPIEVRGNADQLLSAVVNLVDNAVKYSDAGDVVTIAAGGGHTEPGPADVEIRVRDTGRGIPHRDLDRIFERFYRVDRSRDTETGGTGIGLSIVRHVALNHGGSVGVESFEGEGSTFTISLPMVVSAVESVGVEE